MKNILTKLEIIDFYFQKIENFLGKKHKNLAGRDAKSNCGESVYTGSPRSVTSERLNTLEEEIKSETDYTGSFDQQTKTYEMKVLNKGLSKINEEIEDSDDEESKQKTSKGKRLTERDLMGLNEETVMFKDFTEPDVIKTGYLIPLNCGHNG